jgi:hypothetical protein
MAASPVIESNLEGVQTTEEALGNVRGDPATRVAHAQGVNLIAYDAS